VQFSLRDRLRAATGGWSTHLLVLAATTFFVGLGQGAINGAHTNFLVDVLALSGRQVLWMQGIREIPGLILVFIAALIIRWPLPRRAGFAVLLMGLGYGLHATIRSYSGVLAVAVTASLGFHIWMPLQSTLGLTLSKKADSGRTLGLLASIAALASIGGMGLTALTASLLPLRALYILGGSAMLLGGLLLWRIPSSVGESQVGQPRLIFKRKYWLYYVLILFDGARTQVFGAFGTLILVQHYGLGAREIALLLVTSSAVNFFLAPRLGRLLDRVGERITLSVSYVALALCFVGYATVHNVWFLCGMLICINLLITLGIGLSTYVNRIAPPEELGPTLSAGVSVNHITSVSTALVAGTLLSLVGYEALCWGAATIIMFSVPFALAIRVTPPVPIRLAAEA
jgi:predicted MFS family arabinose efflux permease